MLWEDSWEEATDHSDPTGDLTDPAPASVTRDVLDPGVTSSTSTPALEEPATRGVLDPTALSSTSTEAAVEDLVTRAAQARPVLSSTLVRDLVTRDALDQSVIRSTLDQEGSADLQPTTRDVSDQNAIKSTLGD